MHLKIIKTKLNCILTFILHSDQEITFCNSFFTNWTLLNKRLKSALWSFKSISNLFNYLCQIFINERLESLFKVGEINLVLFIWIKGFEQHVKRITIKILKPFLVYSSYLIEIKNPVTILIIFLCKFLKCITMHTKVLIKLFH